MAKEKSIKISKKKNSYDNKVIKLIVGGLAAFLAIVIALVVVISMTTGYVAKVDGVGIFNSKIHDYEYKHFLQVAMSEIYQEAIEDNEEYEAKTDEEKEAFYEGFWTEEMKQKAIDRALEEARQFKAQYQLAVDAGHKLTLDEKANIKDNISEQKNMYVQYYGYTEQQVEDFVFGMKTSDYKDFMIAYTTINSYKAELQKDINPTDDEIYAVYEENPDDYRSVSVRVHQINIGATKPTDEKAEKYDEDLKKYNEAKNAASTEADNILSTYEADKKMEVPQKDATTGKDKTDKDGNVIKDSYTFEEYIKAFSDDSSKSSNGGLYNINKNSKHKEEKINDFAFSMQWNKDRTEIVKVEEKDGEKIEDSFTRVKLDEKKDKDKYDYYKIETETAFYIVRVEDITDYENSVESSKGAGDSIKDVIKANLINDLTNEKIESLVNAKGDKFKIKGKKNDEIKKISNEIFP